jgi:hypothetical protein
VVLQSLWLRLERELAEIQEIRRRKRHAGMMFPKEF